MTLYLTDMDGTLLDAHAVLRQESIRILNALLRRGLLLTAASGRTPISALPILQPLDLSLPLILANGALLCDPKGTSCTCMASFPKESIAALQAAEARFSISGLLLMEKEGQLFSLHQKERRQTWETFFPLPPRQQYPLFATFDESSGQDPFSGHVIYALYMEDNPEPLGQMAALLSEEKGLVCDYYKDRYTENHWCLEITPAAADKGKTALWLKARCGVDRMAAFGDGVNDLPLFAVCDEAFAVQGADPAVAEAASAVIDACEGDGVALFLQKRCADGSLH